MYVLYVHNRAILCAHGFLLETLEISDLPPQHQTDIEAKQMSECSRLRLRYWPKKLSLNEHLADEGTSFLAFLWHSELHKLMVFPSLSLSNSELTECVDVSKYHCSFLRKNFTFEDGWVWKIKGRSEEEDKEGQWIRKRRKLNKWRKGPDRKINSEC